MLAVVRDGPQDGRLGGPFGGPGARCGRVRNDTAATIPRFGILGLDGPVFDPGQDESAFLAAPLVLAGSMPDSDLHTDGRFAIALTPIKAAALGPAVLAGVCAVRLEVAEAMAAVRFADIKDGSAAVLAAAPTGPAVILWRDPGSGAWPRTVWGLVRLGAVAGAVGPAPFYPAKVIDSLGSAAYNVLEQVCTGAGTFADKGGASTLTAYNLAELTLGPGGAVDDDEIVMVTPIVDTGSVTRYIFDHPVYAKYLD